MKNRKVKAVWEEIAFYVLFGGFVVYGIFSLPFLDLMPVTTLLSSLLFIVVSSLAFFYLEKVTERFWLVMAGGIFAMIIVAAIFLAVLFWLCDN